MSEKNQLLINFILKKDYHEQDFYVSSSNKHAFNIIYSWPKWLKKNCKFIWRKIFWKNAFIKNS